MSRRILVIEDDEFVRQSLVVLLLRQRYDVAAAADGREGLALLQVQSFDLVITDILMPKQDGIETLLAIHRARIRVPVIAISAGFEIDPEFYLKMAKTLGANRTLKKPFNAEELLATVGELLPPAN